MKYWSKIIDANNRRKNPEAYKDDKKREVVEKIKKKTFRDTIMGGK